MQKNVTSQKFIVFAFDSTTGLPKTGDAGNITAYVSKDFGTVTVLGDTSATEMDATNAKGYYLFDATQGETNGDILLVSAKSSTSNIVVIGAPSAIFTTPPNYTLAVIDSSGRVDLGKINGSAPAAVNQGEAAKVIVRGTVGSSSTTTSIITSAITPAVGATGSLIGRVVIFDAGTSTTTLRGQASPITASTTGGVLTVATLVAAPASGDTFGVY